MGGQAHSPCLERPWLYWAPGSIASKESSLGNGVGPTGSFLLPSQQWGCGFHVDASRAQSVLLQSDGPLLCAAETDFGK